MKKFVWRPLSALLLLSGLIMLAACRTQDIRTVTIKVPQIKNAQCEKLIQAALSKTDGVDATSIRFGPGAVTVTYDSMKLAIKNIQHLIAELGFDADEIAATPEARAKLLPECR